MKKILLSIFLFINLFGITQNPFETIDYINSQIEESTKSLYNKSMIDQLSLTSDGKLEIDNYLIVNDQLILVEARACYIKQLSFDQFKELIIRNNPSVYYLGLKCSTQSLCILRQIPGSSGDKVENMGFHVYNEEIAKRIENALRHLIKSSLENKNFNEKDPFDI